MYFEIVKPFNFFLLSLLLSAYAIDIALLYRHGIIVFRTHMVLTHTHGVLVLLHYTSTGSPSVA